MSMQLEAKVTRLEARIAALEAAMARNAVLGPAELPDSKLFGNVPRETLTLKPRVMNGRT